MRKTLPLQLELGRIRDGTHRSKSENGLNGAFSIRGPQGVLLAIIASDGTDPISEGWEHVSVSLKNRCPTWREMCFVKALFWEDTEWVVQFHPALSRHVNIHPYCLHLWRKPGTELPKPPLGLI
jgi:hypothetical protein